MKQATRASAWRGSCASGKGWRSRRLLTAVGDATTRSEGGQIALSIVLPEGPTPVRWRALLRQFAASALEPVRSMLELLWPRRRGEAAARLAAASQSTVGVVGAHGLLPSDRDDLSQAVGRAAAELRGNGLRVEEHVRRGEPAYVLTDVAEQLKARLIVVGAGGRGKTARRLVGSVADTVSERSPCDVLIVRRRMQ